MGGTKGISNNVDYSAFRFVTSEKAKKVTDSAGSSKSRIHLFDYKGKEGHDRYAVAAKQMQYASDADAKLGSFNRRYFLYKHIAENGQPTWYKINKNSFIKRLNLSEKDLQISDTGICTNFKNLVDPKQQRLAQCQSLLTSPLRNKFEKNLFHQLVLGKVSLDSYKKIVFFPKDSVDTFLNYTNLTYEEIEKLPQNSLLIFEYGKKIGYGNQLYLFIMNSNEKAANSRTIIEVYGDSYENVLKGKTIVLS